MNNNKISIGNCGEYFVAAELERRGFTAAVPMSNTKDFDVLAINRETNRQVAIQVKTSYKVTKTWTLNQKADNFFGKDIYYIFISLNELNSPTFYIIESELVSKSVRESHLKWLNTLGKNGNPHNDNPVRKFAFDNTKDNILNLKSEDYISRWDKLK